MQNFTLITSELTSNFQFNSVDNNLLIDALHNEEFYSWNLFIKNTINTNDITSSPSEIFKLSKLHNEKKLTINFKIEIQDKMKKITKLICY